MYGINDETWGTDLVSALVAAGAGYAATALAKAGMPGTALITDAVLGIGGLATKHMATGRPYLHESLEALGYSGFYGLGVWAAEATTTPGGHKPAAAPFWQPHAAAATGGAVQARVQAIRRAAAAAAGVKPAEPPALQVSLAEDF